MSQVLHRAWPSPLPAALDGVGTSARSTAARKVWASRIHIRGTRADHSIINISPRTSTRSTRHSLPLATMTIDPRHPPCFRHPSHLVIPQRSCPTHRHCRRPSAALPSLQHAPLQRYTTYRFPPPLASLSRTFLSPRFVPQTAERCASAPTLQLPSFPTTSQATSI